MGFPIILYPNLTVEVHPQGEALRWCGADGRWAEREGFRADRGGGIARVGTATEEKSVGEREDELRISGEEWQGAGESVQRLRRGVVSAQLQEGWTDYSRCIEEHYNSDRIDTLQVGKQILFCH